MKFFMLHCFNLFVFSVINLNIMFETFVIFGGIHWWVPLGSFFILQILVTYLYVEKIRSRIEESIILFIKNYYFKKIMNLLHDFFEDDDEKRYIWLTTKNPMLGNITPVKMIGDGRHKNLLKFIKTSMGENYRKPSKDDQPYFKCPKCKKKSYHPKDIEKSYCGKCHEFY